MTAVVIALSILALVPLILVWPHVGILAWTWIGVMNPHRWAWGSLEVLGYAQIIGMVTLFAWVVSREPKRLPLTPITFLLGLFLVWVTLTTATAHVPGQAWESWSQAFKIILMTFATIALINTRERLHSLILVLVISLGYYGFKGGVFTFLTGGEYRVWGPEKSFIGSNNQLALALVMICPAIVYLRAHTANRYVRLGLLVLAGTCVFSIIGSQSRGAFLALTVMGLFLVWNSRRRLVIGAAALAIGLLAVSFVPDTWVDRMSTIQDYENDNSALSRLKMWTFAIEVAKDRPLTGGGFNVFMDEEYVHKLVKDDGKVWNFHSVYFEVIGEQGFIGLSIFLSLLGATWLTLSRLVSQTRGYANLTWAQDLSRMLQVSLIGYGVGGAFLNLAFFDLIYIVIAITVIVRALAAAEIQPVARRAREPRSVSVGDATFSAAGTKQAPTGTGARTASCRQVAARRRLHDET